MTDERSVDGAGETPVDQSAADAASSGGVRASGRARSGEFHELLSRAIDARGLTLARIRAHLRRRGHDLSPAALSYWRRGLAHPTRATSMEVVAALEDVLEVRRGVLTGALDRFSDPDDSLDGPPGITALTESLGLSWDDGLRRTSIHDVLTLDSRGRRIENIVRETFRAVRDGVDRFPVAFHEEIPGAVVTYSAGAACAVGRVLRQDSIVVAEILLPHALQAGEAWMVEYVLTTANAGQPTTRWGRHTTWRIRDLHASIVFDGDTVPVEAVLILDEGGAVKRIPQVLSGPSLDVHLEDFGSGAAILDWVWPPGLSATEEA